MALKKGDRVILTQDYSSAVTKGMTGIYQGMDPGGTYHVVRLDNFTQGHSGGGTIPGSRACQFLDLNYFELLDKLRVDDRVVCIQEYLRASSSKNITVGMQGVLKVINGANYTVKWDNYAHGHDGGIEPGSFAYCHVHEHHLAKHSNANIEKEEPPEVFTNPFDTSDVFKPEVINRIWEVTMGRPVEYPKLEALVEEKEKYTISDEPLEVGCFAVAQGDGAKLKTGDVFKVVLLSDKHGDKEYVTLVTVDTGFWPVGTEVVYYKRRFKKGVSNFGADDTYFFSKPKKYTREQIEDMWKATQELSQG